MPANGTSLISAGFTPDPILVQMTVSGTYDVTDNAAMAAEGGIGSINPSKPDYRIVYSGAGTTPLILAFSADQDGADTALVLNDPEGDWLCVDDASAGNLNPVGTIGDPPPGHLRCMGLGSRQHDSCNRQAYHHGDDARSNRTHRRLTSSTSYR